MRALFAYVLVASIAATPVFARTGSKRAPTPQHERTFVVHPYEAGRHDAPLSYEYNNNLNPDFQLGGSW
jgi:hypothetical protein